MKQMLLGIFLMLLAIWCYQFGVVDDVVLFAAVGTLLPVPAVILVLYGYFSQKK